MFYDITSKILKFADDTKFGLRSGKCCLILGSVNASAQDMGMKMHNTQWVILY